MNSFGVTHWTALIAGVASFFAPCIIPVLPGFLAFLGATAIRTGKSRWRAMEATLIFCLGFASVFSLLGVGAQFFGHALSAERSGFEKIGGILLIVFGLALNGVIPIPSFNSSRILAFVGGLGQFAKNFLFGIIFGFAWIPCIGAILGTILFLATGTETAAHGGLLLFIFSIGLSLPFLVFAFFLPELKKLLGRISFFAHYARGIIGGILILLGLLLFFGKLQEYSGILLQRFGTGFVS